MEHVIYDVPEFPDVHGAFDLHGHLEIYSDQIIFNVDAPTVNRAARGNQSLAMDIQVRLVF